MAVVAVYRLSNRLKVNSLLCISTRNSNLISKIGRQQSSFCKLTYSNNLIYTRLPIARCLRRRLRGKREKAGRGL